MRKRLFTLCFALTAVCASTMAQVEINETNFPDVKFRSLVSKNIDTNKNGKLDESEINADAAKELNVSNQGIKDLTGIQYFTNLKSLYCYGNEISGANMYKLVNLLPAPSSTLGGLIINYNGCTLDNVITKAQAKIAEEKGWLVVRCLNDEDFELYDGEDLTITAKFFPDAKFRGFVTVYDTDNDNILSDTELGKVYEINASGKGITDLTGIEHFYALQTLYCNNNSLTALDVWNNKVLETLDCSKNNVTALDLTNNEDLMWVACYGNNISGTAMDRLVASLHQVSYEAPGYGDLVVCSDQCARDNTITTAQIMTIMEKDWKAWQYVGSDLADMLIKVSVAFDSDANFRAYVASNIDTDGDGYLSMDERKAVTKLDAEKEDFKDLSDVKYFTELTRLVCAQYSLTTLNVSANKKLRELYCDYNSLQSLDVSKNTALTKLDCSYNSLKSLDVSKSTALTTLYCYGNSLESLIFSKNTALTKLDCSNNSLQSLDVSNNTALTELFCTKNSLTSLDVSKNTALTRLDCDYNSLTSLDVSKNTALTTLYCYGNQIKGAAMDNLVNGLPNTGGTLYVCRKNVTPDNVITTSQVRVATDKGWTVKRYDNGWVDYAGVFEPVAIDATNFPDNNFRNYLLAKDFGKDGILTEDEMLAITELNVPGLGIKDMKGIEHFTALTTLNCSFNSLESLDVSKNTALTTLNCSINSLESLDVSNNTALTTLYCGGNSLKSLDLSNNTSLTVLYCSVNSLESLDVSKNTALKGLGCYNNSLESLDVSMNTALTELWCNGNSLKSLDVSKNTALTLLYCNDNSLISLDISKNTALTELYCNGNSLISLDVSKNTALTDLWCHHNSLKSLDVSMNTALEGLYCYNNNLSSLDVSKNTLLTELDCSSNSLESLDVSNNTSLTVLYCSFNSLESLDVSKNTALKGLGCYHNSLTSLVVSNISLLNHLDCSGNQIRGTAMTQLVNNLPTQSSGKNGWINVCDDTTTPDNLITAAQVKIATDKGWYVTKIDYHGGDGFHYAGQGDANGDNKIDKDDLDLIVKIIMGKKPEDLDLGEFAGDLNKDGKTDAADIVVMVNILNGK